MFLVVLGIVLLLCLCLRIRDCRRKRAVAQRQPLAPSSHLEVTSYTHPCQGVLQQMIIRFSLKGCLARGDALGFPRCFELWLLFNGLWILGSPTCLTTLLQAFCFLETMTAPYCWKPYTSDYVTAGVVFFQKGAPHMSQYDY